ncbi:hypothetical protein BDR04DRAFT_1119862 [Suillus decipiens]|nr:hypothetical protein BDR04DRAFT_1119862 [Suillus decipiens]
MLNCADANKEHIDTFIYEIDLLSYADVAQQAFSSEHGSTLHLAIPALKTLYKAWSSYTDRLKYLRFATLLQAAAMKVDKYYEKTMKSPAYIIAILLDPVGKMVYLKQHWPEDLHDKVLTTAEKVVHQPNFNFMHRSNSAASFKAQYFKLNEEGTSLLLLQPASKKSKPWGAKFMSYIEAIKAALPAGMTTIQWWGSKPSSLMELEELDDAELEAESDLKTAGNDGDNKDSWNIILDDTEDDANNEADNEVSDFEMND